MLINSSNQAPRVTVLKRLIDATIVAKGFGILPTLLLERLREGRITGVCERGIDADDG